MNSTTANLENELNASDAYSFDNPKSAEPIHLFAYILLTVALVISLGIAGYFAYQNNKLQQKLQSASNNTIHVQSSSQSVEPKIITNWLKVEYKPAEISRIEDFFSSDSKKTISKTVSWLVANNQVKQQNIIETECSPVFSSNYVDFEKTGIYLDFTDISNEDFQTVVSHPETYAVKDNELKAFIQDENSRLQMQFPNQRINSIQQCKTANNKVIVSYDLQIAPDKAAEETALRIGFLKKNVLEQMTVIPKYEGLFGCSELITYTADDVAFFKCGFGDAGFSEVSAYKVDFSKQTAEEVLNCTSSQVLAEEPTPITRKCRVPVK